MDRIIIVQGTRISILSEGEQDYICLTDMVKANEDVSRAADILKNWIRNRSTIEFLGIWETLYNPNFKVVEFDHFRKSAGLPSFTMSVSNWVDATNAIGIFSKMGKYGGTYAHKDIAYHFGMWFSPEFHLLVVKEFQRLKEDESIRLNSEWQDKRFLAKAAYRLQTDAIKEFMLPALNLPKEKEKYVYATEGDIINVAVFGITARQWEEQNPEKVLRGENMRDTASVIQLVAVVAAESLNKELIKKGISQSERLKALRESALENIRSLTESPSVKKRIINEKGTFDEDLSKFNKSLATALEYNPNA
jgi:hypothetical protein